MKLRIKRKKIPLTLTLLRLILSPLIFIVILFETKNVGIFLFIFSATIAFFSSILSKRKTSQLISIVEVIADKLLINLTTLALYYKNILPIWVVLIFLGRDLFTILGGSVLLYRDRRREFKPTLIGKINLFFQIISLIPAIAHSVDWVLIFISISLTIISALELLFKSEFKLVRRTDIDEFRITKLIKPADLLTLMNAVFGLTAILYSITSRYNLAAIMLIIAAIFDFFDGKIAALSKTSNEFGKELDSLADTISFGVAPAVFAFSLIQTPLAMVSFAIFLFCGILRLARYNIMDLKGEFEGMPITMNGLIIPLIYFLDFPIDYFPYIYLGLGILMISSLRVRKL